MMGVCHHPTPIWPCGCEHPQGHCVSEANGYSAATGVIVVETSNRCGLSYVDRIE